MLNLALIYGVWKICLNLKSISTRIPWKPSMCSKRHGFKFRCLSIWLWTSRLEHRTVNSWLSTLSNHLFLLLYDKSQMEYKENRKEINITSALQNDNAVTLSFCMYRKIWLPSMCLHTYTEVGFRSLRKQRFQVHRQFLSHFTYFFYLFYYVTECFTE